MSLVTGLDGYPLARSGRAREALGASAMASFLSGVSGVVLLVIAAPILASALVLFGPSQFVWIYVLTLVVVAVSFNGAKGLASGLFGLILAAVGLDVVVGVPRYTFGSASLEGGIELIPALVGLFGVSEACSLMVQQWRSRDAKLTAQRLEGSTRAGMRAVFRHYKTLLISIGIGGILGPVPGMGSTAGNILAWQSARNRSKEPETFGRGNIEGVVAAESGNNVVEGTSLISTITLGIPGSASAAVLLTALIVQGFQPGRTLAQDPSFIFSLGWLLLMAQVAMFGVGLMCLRGAAYIATIPPKFLAPSILAFCFIGVFTVRNTFSDVVICAVLGCVGYVMRQFGYAPVAVVVGLILGKLMERSLIQSLAISGGSLGIFFSGWINITLAAITAAFILRYFLGKRRTSVAKV
jgi:putative tricarboxylic transport membrane protein